MKRSIVILALSAALLSACSPVEDQPADAKGGVTSVDRAATDTVVATDLQSAVSNVQLFEVDHAGAFPTVLQDLLSEGLRLSDGTEMWIIGNGETLCLSAWNPASKKAPTRDATFRWDSTSRMILMPGTEGSGACTGIV